MAIKEYFNVTAVGKMSRFPLVFLLLIGISGCPALAFIKLSENPTVDHLIFYIDESVAFSSRRPLTCSFAIYAFKNGMPLSEIQSHREAVTETERDCFWSIHCGLHANLDLLDSVEYGKLPEGFIEDKPPLPLSVGSYYANTNTTTGYIVFNILEDGSVKNKNIMVDDMGRTFVIADSVAVD